jgi:L-threonylcarbamoyladenylate synthase
MVRTQCWRVDAEKPDRRLIREAAGVLKRGGLVAFPTETVYGLGALIYLRDAVKRIFEVKGRPPDNPLIVHVAGLDQLYEVAREVPEKALKLAKVFWPGPLTVVLPKSGGVPDEVTAGLPKVAVRMPAHAVALALIEEVGAPVAAPSANLSGRPSPTSAEHVLKDLGGRIEGVLDAGETLYGLESTIVDLTTSPPTLLRPGAMPIEKVEEVLGERVAIPDFARGLGEAEQALAPGTKYRHYAPRATLLVVEAGDYTDLMELNEAVKSIAAAKAAEGLKVCVLCTEETLPFYVGLKPDVALKCLGSRRNIFTVARNLFKTLRSIDDEGFEFAVVEGFEERGLGLAVMNRLRKASGFNIVRV